MKKVRYRNIGSWSYGSLVDGTIYDVIRYIPSNVDSIYDRVEIYNNGKPCIYDVYSLNICILEDVTAELRNNVIDSILL